jgi:hypothetical protein
MIEAQQQIINCNPGRPFMPTVHDRGVTLYTRLKAKLIAAESGGSGKSEELTAAN